MEKLDYKKKYKNLYQPTAKPSIADIPEMLFLAVDGAGDPNTCPAYQQALELLYGLSFTIKMSKMNGTQPPGYFEYVVPPLEGLWYVDDAHFDGQNVTDKSRFRWTSMIRQPEFVTESVLEQAKAVLSQKKPALDCSKARLMQWTEGLCIQVMHKGSYDDEPASILKLKEFAAQNGYAEDFSNHRFHHEIYLSDPRRCALESLKTIIRHPVQQITENSR